MSTDHSRHPLTLKRVVYHLEGMESVRVQRDVSYADGETGGRVLDAYYPGPPASATRAPVVVFVTGFPDVGVSNPLGCRFKDMEMSRSLAKLVAVSGMTAVTYSARRPATDIATVLDYLRSHAETLQVDPSRAGLWAWSGHVPVALSALMNSPGAFRAAVLSNGLMLDLKGSAVADAARAYGFVNACAGHTVDDLPAAVPLFIARSGRDELPGLNEALDEFVTAAAKRALPFTLANHPTAPHCFELHDDSEVSRAIINQMLTFIRYHLT